MRSSYISGWLTALLSVLVKQQIKWALVRWKGQCWNSSNTLSLHLATGVIFLQLLTFCSLYHYFTISDWINWALQGGPASFRNAHTRAAYTKSHKWHLFIFLFRAEGSLLPPSASPLHVFLWLILPQCAAISPPWEQYINSPCRKGTKKCKEVWLWRLKFPGCAVCVSAAWNKQWVVSSACGLTCWNWSLVLYTEVRRAVAVQSAGPTSVFIHREIDGFSVLHPR